MKTRTLWVNFITHARARTWRWKPWFLKSSIIYGRGGDTYTAPHWELGWLFLVFHWTGYSHEKKHRPSKFAEHECPSDLMQEYINELSDRNNKLEAAIRQHQSEVGEERSMHVDRQLWKVLDHEREETDQGEV
jgi:hypothetical protein